ncbi:MAG: methyl-accepting chemotaxis protein [Campylobacteraceae bacterium]|nr:methyl-accepting chemotaxis protein [Campylobacteraceae bacterium]
MGNLSLKIKLVSITFYSLIILASVLASISVVNMESALKDENNAKLTSARDSKIKQINTYFNNRVADISILSRNNDVIALTAFLDKQIKEKELEPDETYPTDSYSIQNETEKYQEFLQKYIEVYAYYDLYIISEKEGYVMFSAAQESDNGENLSEGDLKTSGLALAWRKAKELKRPVFVDMKPYEPIADTPAMFLATPIYVNGSFKAVLAFQLSNASINDIMKFKKGYGKTQEDYLVGSDFLMRSDSFLDPKTHSLEKSFEDPKKGSVETKAVKEVFANKKAHIEVIKNYKNKEVLSAYSSLKIDDDLKWAIVSEIEMEEVLITTNKVKNNIILATLVILVIIVFIAYALINIKVIKPLEKFQTGLLGFFKYLNKESSTVEELPVFMNDEIGQMSKAVNENILKIQAAIEEDNKFINEVTKVVALVKDGKFQQQIGNVSQNKSLEELKIIINEMLEVLCKTVCTDVNDITKILHEYQHLNFNARLDCTVGNVSQGLNNLADIVNEMLVDNKRNGLTLNNSANVLSQNVDELNRNSNETAVSLEEASASLEEITSEITINTESIMKMSAYSKELTVSAKEGEVLANKTIESMDEINAEVTEINNAIGVIDQIAFQTNILSLNAAVEAATAGEAGKGFAVVAQEVRNLASRSAEAAKQIKELVENANEKANSGKKIADTMIEGFSNLNENLNKTMELINSVEKNSKDQKIRIEMINESVTMLDEKTQQNAAIANKAYEISQSTLDIADDIVKDANEKEFIGKDNIDLTKPKKKKIIASADDGFEKF